MRCREITRKLTQEAFFLMFAGTDTTSYTLMKCALTLDRNPEWFQRLKDEQDALRAEYGDAIDRKVSAPAVQPPPQNPLVSGIVSLTQRSVESMCVCRFRVHCWLQKNSIACPLLFIMISRRLVMHQ